MGEGNAGGDGLHGFVAAGVVEGAGAECFVDAVHGLIELAAFGGLSRFEHVGGGLIFGNQVAEGEGYFQGDAADVGLACPEFFEALGEGDGVLGFEKRDVAAPFLFSAVADGEDERAGAVVHVAQAGGGFLQETMAEGVGGVFVAELRREDATVPDGGTLRLFVREPTSAQILVHAGAANASPYSPELVAGGLAESAHGPNAGALYPF